MTPTLRTPPYSLKPICPARLPPSLPSLLAGDLAASGEPWRAVPAPEDASDPARNPAPGPRGRGRSGRPDHAPAPAPGCRVRGPNRQARRRGARDGPPRVRRVRPGGHRRPHAGDGRTGAGPEAAAALARPPRALHLGLRRGAVGRLPPQREPGRRCSASRSISTSFFGKSPGCSAFRDPRGRAGPGAGPDGDARRRAGAGQRARSRRPRHRRAGPDPDHFHRPASRARRRAPRRRCTSSPARTSGGPAPSPCPRPSASLPVSRPPG